MAQADPSPINLEQRRPLSPHLQIYRPMLTMMMSIAHRISGASLAVGFLLLAWWLIAIAAGPEQYATVSHFFAGIPGRVLLFLFSWALLHHMLGGIRHFIWDSIHALDPVGRETIVRIQFALSILLTLGAWAIFVWFR